jgi:LEA14-like dessication related protein
MSVKGGWQMRAMVQYGLLLLMVLGACKSTPTNAGDSGDVQVSVERVLPKPESLDASAVEVVLKIFNPTAKPVQIKSVDYEIDTRDVSGLLKGESTSSETIEAAQTAELTFSKSVPFPQDKEAYQAVIEKGSFPADLKGKVRFADGKSLSFERKGEVATPTLPKFIVYDAQAARYEKEGLDVTIFLRLINENVFPVQIEGVRYTVYIEDKKIKSEQAAIGTRLLQGAAEEFEVTQILDDKVLEKGRVKKILAAGKVTYKVTGKLDIGRLTLPFEYPGEIELGSSE